MLNIAQQHKTIDFDIIKFTINENISDPQQKTISIG